VLHICSSLEKLFEKGFELVMMMSSAGGVSYSVYCIYDHVPQESKGPTAKHLERSQGPTRLMFERDRTTLDYYKNRFTHKSLMIW